MDNILLEVKGITKSFPGVLALDNVSFRVNRSEVHALLGENGAGKSTLIKVLAGINIPDSGEILIDGKREHISSVKYSQSLGISVIHQEISLIPKLTVANNIYLGREGSKFFLNDKEILKNAISLINEFGFSIRPNTIVEDLSIAQQQMVEIVRALSINAKIIIMDEPTASISDEDTQKLFSVIKKLKYKGVSVIYISHRLEEIFQIADKITVLRDGCLVDTVDADQTDREKLISMMVGRKLEEVFHYNISETGDTILKLENISNTYLKDINLCLKKGEILGIAGLVGSGRTEIAKAIFGIVNYKGNIYIDGVIKRMRTPSDSIESGIVLIPENRKEQGLIMKNSISFNLMLQILKTFINGIHMNKKKAAGISNEYVRRLNIKVSSLDHKMSTLSGGNQQKVVLAKWLATNPRILILDEPTRGIDVGAKFEIYELMFELVRKGISIILISSELPEIINLCTRTIIIRDGRVVGELDRVGTSQEKVMHYCTGGLCI